MTSLIAVVFLIFAIIRACSLSGENTGSSYSETHLEKPDETEQTDGQIDLAIETIPEIESAEYKESAEAMKVDADQYFAENSEVLSVTEVGKSESVETESTAVQNMSERGFTQNPVSAEFTMDGEYVENQEATISGKAK